MVVSATVVMVKVSRGSRSTFAYTLMALSVVLGVSYFGYAFAYAFRMEVELSDRVYHFYSWYAYEVFTFCLIWLLYKDGYLRCATWTVP